jgi:predicted membrane channel-forming protein YqfA (hemolysin III family)
MKKISLVTAGLLGLMPVLASAQQSIQNFVSGTLTTFLNSLIPLLITVGVIYFIYGVITYVIADDEEAKGSGKNRMLWGLIGMFVIVTFWGLISVIQNTLQVQPTAPPVIDINPY